MSNNAALRQCGFELETDASGTRGRMKHHFTGSNVPLSFHVGTGTGMT